MDSVTQAPLSRIKKPVPVRVPAPVPANVIFSGPCTNFVFGQPGSYYISMVQAPLPIQQPPR